MVQGGTFHNDAVLRAFEQELGRNVTRPTIAGLMGAFGAALAARDLHLEKSTLLSEKALQGFTHSAKPVTCGLCTNHCSSPSTSSTAGGSFISGNRCSRPLGKEKVELPDLMNYKYKAQGPGGQGERQRRPRQDGHSLRPQYVREPSLLVRVLHALNFEVVLSPSPPESSTSKASTPSLRHRVLPPQSCCTATWRPWWSRVWTPSGTPACPTTTTRASATTTLTAR